MRRPGRVPGVTGAPPGMRERSRSLGLNFARTPRAAVATCSPSNNLQSFSTTAHGGRIYTSIIRRGNGLIAAQQPPPPAGGASGTSTKVGHLSPHYNGRKRPPPVALLDLIRGLPGICAITSTAIFLFLPEVREFIRDAKPRTNTTRDVCSLF